MSKLKKWFKENITTTDWIAIFILLLAVIGIFYLPLWVTQKSWKYDLGETESNEIADTIGGILGPFISFISACLVYLALREQVKANRLIQLQFLTENKSKFESQIFAHTIVVLEKEVQAIEKFKSSHRQYKGPENFYEAIIALLVTDKKVRNEAKTEFYESPFEIIHNISNCLTLFNENVLLDKAYFIIVNEKLLELKSFIASKLMQLDLQNGTLLDSLKDDLEYLSFIECMLRLTFEMEVISIKLGNSHAYFSKDYFLKTTNQLDEIFWAQETVSTHEIDIKIFKPLITNMKQLILLLLLLSLTTTAQKPKPFKAIAFYKAKNDQAHISFVHEANLWFPVVAAKYNFTYDSTDNWENLNDVFLAKYQLVIFLDTRPEDANQRKAFQKYMENGGAWLGFHFAGFALNNSKFN